MFASMQIMLVLWLVLAAPAAAALAGEPDISGIWRGSFYGSDVQAHVEQDGQAVKAEVVVHALNGETNVYHLVGAIFNGHMYMLHGSGHVFEGDAKGCSITGVLTTKGGSRLELSATKVPQASGGTVPGGTPGAGGAEGSGSSGGPGGAGTARQPG